MTGFLRALAERVAGEPHEWHAHVPARFEAVQAIALEDHEQAADDAHHRHSCSSLRRRRRPRRPRRRRHASLGAAGHAADARGRRAAPLSGCDGRHGADGSRRLPSGAATAPRATDARRRGRPAGRARARSTTSRARPSVDRSLRHASPGRRGAPAPARPPPRAARPRRAGGGSVAGATAGTAIDPDPADAGHPAPTARSPDDDRRAPATPAPIHVRIGRVDVRAVMAPEPVAPGVRRAVAAHTVPTSRSTSAAPGGRRLSELRPYAFAAVSAVIRGRLARLPHGVRRVVGGGRPHVHGASPRPCAHRRPGEERRQHLPLSGQPQPGVGHDRTTDAQRRRQPRRRPAARCRPALRHQRLRLGLVHRRHPPRPRRRGVLRGAGAHPGGDPQGAGAEPARSDDPGAGRPVPARRPARTGEDRPHHPVVGGAVAAVGVVQRAVSAERLLRRRRGADRPAARLRRAAAGRRRGRVHHRRERTGDRLRHRRRSAQRPDRLRLDARGGRARLRRRRRHRAPRRVDAPRRAP